MSSYYTDLPFEAGFLGGPVWRLNDASKAAEAVRAAEGNIGLVSCRIDAGEDKSQLVQAGFRQVETLITLRADIWKVEEMPAGVRRTQIEDASDCADVARIAFKDDRFHKDPEIPDRVADDIKAAWVENSVKGRANAVFCMEINREIIAFNACLLQGDEAVIDLIGVHPQVQGQGIGRKLLDAMALNYWGRVSAIRLGTQLSNESSLGFYKALGFVEVGRAHSWHWTPNR